MSLPDKWVDAIFERCTLVYGQDFLRRWDGMNLVGVKADWARELSPYRAAPEAISYALEHLSPDRPPTVLQFRDLCRHAPQRAQPLLPGEPQDPQRVQQALAKLGQVRGGKRHPRAWALALKQREESGEHLSPFQKACWREALAPAMRAALAEEEDQAA